MAKSRRQQASADWKKSPAVMAGAIVVIVLCWAYFIWDWTSGGAIILKDFPYQYITEVKGATPIEIRENSNARKQVPFKLDGQPDYYWEAWTCLNTACPYLRTSNGQARIFPLVDEGKRKWADAGYPEEDPSMMPMMGMMPPMCPVCKQTSVDVYYTAEGTQKMNEYREAVMKAYK